MAIPLLDYPLTSQNARVSNLAGNLHDNGLATIGYGGAGHDSYNSEVDGVIEQAYRQIFFHAMRSDRDVNLESQLRNGNITVRDFIRGLLLSNRFRDDYYQCSTNYRMVDQVVGRALGRPVHGDAERRAWSIVIGEKGFNALLINFSTATNTWPALAMTAFQSSAPASCLAKPQAKSPSISAFPATAPTGATACKSVHLAPTSKSVAVPRCRCRRFGPMVNHRPGP